MRIPYVASVGTALVSVGLALATGAAQAADISVSVNQAKVLKLTRPADTIIIGNPQIADASVQDATTIVLTGRAFGATNLVVLDGDGAPIVDQQVVVSRHEAGTIRIYRRAAIETLSCTPNCEAAYLSDAESAGSDAP
jgi:Flp pilus assembly secretin CpaC